jgi:hypothetical protein
MTGLGQFGLRRRPTAFGRFKPADFDVAMSGEDVAAAIGRVQVYASSSYHGRRCNSCGATQSA